VPSFDRLRTNGFGVKVSTNKRRVTQVDGVLVRAGYGWQAVSLSAAALAKADMPASLLAAFDPIWRVFGRLTTKTMNNPG